MDPGELPAAADAVNRRYDGLVRIGAGTFGTVFKARDQTTGRYVALKRVMLGQCPDGVPATTLREVSLLKSLRHPYIVRLFDVIVSRDRLFMVFEYLDCDLRSFLNAQPTRLDPRLVKRFTYQILMGLQYCHAHRILHRDLKPQNVLVRTSTQSITLADFGLARTFLLKREGKVYSHEIVTLWYRSPEVLLGKPEYDDEVDIWSTGCILAEMLTKRPLFPGDSQIDQLFRIFRLMGTPREASWPGVSALPNYKQSFPDWIGKDLRTAVPVDDEGALALLGRMLKMNPRERSSADTLLRHEWFGTVSGQFEDDSAAMDSRDASLATQAAQALLKAIAMYNQAREIHHREDFALRNDPSSQQVARSAAKAKASLRSAAATLHFARENAAQFEPGPGKEPTGIEIFERAIQEAVYNPVHTRAARLYLQSRRSRAAAAAPDPDGVRLGVVPNRRQQAPAVVAPVAQWAQQAANATAVAPLAGGGGRLGDDVSERMDEGREDDDDDDEGWLAVDADGEEEML